MRRNYFAKVVKYMKNVYNIEQKLKGLTDGRKKSKYKTHQAILPVLLGFIFRVRSFNELNNMIKEKEFNNVLPKGVTLPKIDAIRDTLKVVDLLKLREILREIDRKFNISQFKGGMWSRTLFCAWWKSNRGGIVFDLYCFEYCSIILLQKDKEITKNASRTNKAID